MGKKKPTLTLGVAGIVVTRASAILFVVTTVVRKGRRVSHLILHYPCAEGFNGEFEVSL